MVRFENVPCRSGSPQGVRGGVHVLVAALAAFAGAADVCASAALDESSTMRPTTVSTRVARCVFITIPLCAFGPWLKINLRCQLGKACRQNRRRHKPVAARNEAL